MCCVPVTACITAPGAAVDACSSELGFTRGLASHACKSSGGFCFRLHSCQPDAGKHNASAGPAICSASQWPAGTRHSPSTGPGRRWEPPRTRGTRALLEMRSCPGVGVQAPLGAAPPRAWAARPSGGVSRRLPAQLATALASVTSLTLSPEKHVAQTAVCILPAHGRPALAAPSSPLSCRETRGPHAACCQHLLRGP